jgi:hypothetical protein
LTHAVTWPGAAAPLAATPGHDTLTPDVAGDPTAWFSVLLGGLIVAAAAIAPGLLARRRTVKSDLRAAWVMAAPFVLAGTYIVFHGLTQVLSPTI